MQEITGKRNKVAFCEKFLNNYFIIIIIKRVFWYISVSSESLPVACRNSALWSS